MPISAKPAPASPHTDAVSFLSDLPVVEKEVWSQLLPELKALTFTIKLTKDADSAVKRAAFHEVMQDCRDLIASIPAGADARKVERQIAAKLNPFFDTPEAAMAKAKFLVSHWAGIARAAAWHRTLKKQLAAYPYWKYVTFGDDRVRPAHAALNGKILPADSPFWDTHFPPWAAGCRCMVVPITQAEYDRIKAAEAHLPPEQRSIVEGDALRELEENNKLTAAPMFRDTKTGEKQFGKKEEFDTAPGKNWKGWNPDDLRISYEALQERYKDRPEELAKLMNQADRMQIAPGITLGQYIRGLGPGRKLPAIGEKGAKPEGSSSPQGAQRGTEISQGGKKGPKDSRPAAKPKEQAPAKSDERQLIPAVKPASDKPADQIAASLKLELKDPVAERRVKEACEIVSSLHSVSGLGVSPVRLKAMPFEGLYQPVYASDAAMKAHPEVFESRIYLKQGVEPNRTDILHEFAHNIEARAIAVRSMDIPPPDYVHHQSGWKVFQKIITALEATPRVKKDITHSGLEFESIIYLTRHCELFARAYAQYVTRRTGSAELAADLDAVSERYDGLWQWPDDQFARMIPLFDLLFKTLGWLQ